MGGGVVDRLRQLKRDVIEVQFGSKPDDGRKYANKRAEMWGRMKDWLAIGGLPRDEVLATDLTGVEYGFRPDDSILLESKESMKKRGQASPDDGDALALTFAHPVPEFKPERPPAGVHSRAAAREHDPYAAISCNP